MKNVIFIALVLFLTSCATIQSENTVKRTSFEKVHHIDGYSKEVIHSMANIWVAETFRSAKAVTEYSNKEDGKIIGNAIINFPCEGFSCFAKSEWKIHFTINIDIKDNKFRTRFLNIQLSIPASRNSSIFSPGYKGPLNDGDDFNNVKKKLLILAEGIKNKIINSSNDDW